MILFITRLNTFQPTISFSYSQWIAWKTLAGTTKGIVEISSTILTKQIIAGKINQTGATPSINLISLDEYLAELNIFNIHVYSEVI